MVGETAWGNAGTGADSVAATYRRYFFSNISVLPDQTLGEPHLFRCQVAIAIMCSGTESPYDIARQRC